MSNDIKAVADAALPHIDSLVRSWLPGCKKEGQDFIAINPTRADKNPGSFRISPNGKWRDAASNDGGGDLVALYAYLNGIRQIEAAKEIAAQLGMSYLFSSRDNNTSTKPAPDINEFLEATKPATEHAYLAKKGVPSHRLLISTKDYKNLRAGDLIIPLFIDGKISTLQGISSTGQKRLLAGAKAKGAYYVIDGDLPAIVAEGYATSASVHRITGRKVFAAVSAGNITEVCKSFPEIELVAADNDADGAGQKAARKTKLAYSMPPEPGDWNDYEQKHGLEPSKQAFHKCTKYRPDDVLNKLFAGRGDSFIQVPKAITETVIGKLALRTANTLEMPLGSVLVTLLAGASASAAATYATEFISGTSVSLGIYAVAEQPPSTQKSRVIGIALAAYQRAIAKHNKAIYAHNSDEETPKAERLPFAFNSMSDATSAALDKELSKKDSGRFVIASAEQAAFQTLFPDSGSYSSHNGLLLNGWAGEWVAGSRAGRESFEGITWGAIGLFAQEGSIQRVLSASQGQGLTERFLFASEPSQLGKRTFANGYLTDNDTTAFNKAAAACLIGYRDRLQFKDGALDNCTGFDYLQTIKPSDAGYQLIHSKKMELEPFLGDLREQGEITYLGWLGKLETHVLKVAGVLHVFDCLGNGCSVPEIIPTSKVESALELVLNIGAHIRRIIQDSGESGQSAEAETIIEVVSTSAKHTEVTAAQRCKNRVPFKALGSRGYRAARKSIGELIQLGILQVNDDGYLQVI